MSLGGELAAVTKGTEDTREEPTVDGSEFTTGSVRGSVCGVLSLCRAVTGDDGLNCDVGCFVESTFGPCAVMLPSSLALIHKPYPSNNIHITQLLAILNTKNTNS